MYAQGRKNRTFTVADGSTINLNYGFINLFWVFNFTYGYRYSVTKMNEDGSTNHKDITKEEATAMNNSTPVMPPVYERYSFLIFVALVVVLYLWRMITT